MRMYKILYKWTGGDVDRSYVHCMLIYRGCLLVKNSFVNISEVNRQCLHSLGTRSEDDFEKVSIFDDVHWTSSCGLWSVAFYSSQFGKSSLLQFSSLLAPILFYSLKLYMAAFEFRASVLGSLFNGELCRWRVFFVFCLSHSLQVNRPKLIFKITQPDQFCTQALQSFGALACFKSPSVCGIIRWSIFNLIQLVFRSINGA